MFGFSQYGKDIYTPKQTWEEWIFTNLITFIDEEHNKELKEHIKLNSRVIPEIREQLIFNNEEILGLFL